MDQDHAAAAHGGDYLPFFITPPGQTDTLFVGIIAFTVLMILLIGVFYFYLHSLPERMAHRRNHTQMQLVGILALLALFTHNDLFWVAALLLVALQLPDFLTPITRIANALEDGRAARAAGGAADGTAEATADRSAAPTEPVPGPDGAPAGTRRHA